jgi:transcriptional regulator with PAS, ATPase and Fis domain
MGSSTTLSPSALIPEDVLFGHSEVMATIRDRVKRLAATDVPVLLQGEGGTGKEILAQVIHRYSPYAAGPFVKINCPVLPATGLGEAVENSLPEPAQRGTLFLDEVAELAPVLQPRLMQLLQNSQTCRIGAVEGRLICATNRQLQDEVEAGTFRQDLFYRINVVTLHVPPLHKRRQDIPELVAYFLDQFGRAFNCPVKPLSASLLRALDAYHWPGNIRELENLMKRYVILGNEEAVTSEFARHSHHHASGEPTPDGTVSLKSVARQAAREAERQVILRSLQANNWNRKRVARALRISYRALLYKIRDAGLGHGRRSRPGDSGEFSQKDAA